MTSTQRHGEPGEEGRFSEGEEELPDSPEKHVERRFSEGIERNPASEWAPFHGNTGPSF